MGAWKRWAPPVVAALGLLIGLLLLDWVAVDAGFGSLHVRPRSSELCEGARCVHVASKARTWNLMSGLALVAGVTSAIGLVTVAVMRFLDADTDRLSRLVAWACAMTIAASLIALVAIAPDAVSDYAVGGPVTVIAATIGIFARGATDGDSAFGGGRSARPIRATVTAPTTTSASNAAPRAPVEAPARSLVGAGVASHGVRFVVIDGTLTATGLTLRFERNVERTVAWADIVEAVARRLPPDPPHDKATLVDLVLTDGTPARLIPASRIDFTALPDGQAANTRENWRRLVALARTHNPAIAIEADSAEFFAGGRDAPMFPAWKKFVDWDRRYGG